MSPGLTDPQAMPSFSLEDIRAAMRDNSSCVVTTHVNPDGDALGSAAALALWLRGKGRRSHIIVDWPVPENLHFLRDSVGIEEYEPAEHDTLLRETDTVFAVDLNAPSRIRRMASVLAASPARILVIDHHLDPKPFAAGYCIASDACSTAELLYDIFDGEGITPAIAEALYVGILTDTGSFRFERTTPRVHRITAELLEYGVDPQQIYRRIYDEYPLHRTRLLGHILAGIRTLQNGRATVLVVRASDLSATGSSLEDVENVVNYGLSIRGVEATALIAETDEGVKVSLRCRGELSVQQLAQRFGGGGHRFAAGATLPGRGVDEIVRDIEKGFADLFQKADSLRKMQSDI